MRTKTWLALLSVLIVVVGCALPAPLQGPADLSAEPAGGEGLQWEADLSAHPPAPQNVEAVVQGAGIRVTWDLPVAVEVPHSYSDTIAHYRVFRRLASSSESIEIGTTDQRYFVDSEPPLGLVFYHVTAVHEGNAESGRSDEAAVVPGSN